MSRVSKAVDDVTLAYMAGMIDADGYITVNRTTRAATGVLHFSARVGVAGTNRIPHDLASSLWGGKVSVHIPKNPNHLPQFQWSRSGRAAANIIHDLQPFLRVKSAQARLVIELQDHLDLRATGYQWLNIDYDPNTTSQQITNEVRELNVAKGRAYKRTWGGSTEQPSPALGRQVPAVA